MKRAPKTPLGTGPDFWRLPKPANDDKTKPAFSSTRTEAGLFANALAQIWRSGNELH
jgi:hypothetical protein